MTSRTPVQVTAAIIRRDGETLIARRRAEDHLGGLWEFPGGKIEDGESPEQCLARELREEFEVDATVGRFIISSRFNYGDREIELLAYEVAIAPGELTLNNHDEVRWVPTADLLQNELAAADIPIAQALVHRDAQD